MYCEMQMNLKWVQWMVMPSPWWANSYPGPETTQKVTVSHQQRIKGKLLLQSDKQCKIQRGEINTLSWHKREQSQGDKKCENKYRWFKLVKGNLNERGKWLADFLSLRVLQTGFLWITQTSNMAARFSSALTVRHGHGHILKQCEPI